MTIGSVYLFGWVVAMNVVHHPTSNRRMDEGDRPFLLEHDF
jgi:hypothetical protein